MSVCLVKGLASLREEERRKKKAKMGSKDITQGLLPFIRAFKDGSVERLRRTHLTPTTSLHLQSDDVQFKDVVIDSEIGLSVRLFRPKSHLQTLPVIIYIHGRCFFVDTPYSTMNLTFLETVVKESQAILVSVDYRKAPEHSLPIAYDDCFATVRWVASRSDEWLQDSEQVFLMGDSAGGNIAHNMAMRVSSENISGVTFEGLVLMNPFFWGKDPVAGEMTKQSERSILDGYWCRACSSSSDGSDSDPDHPWVNPGADPHLSMLGCRRILIFVSEKDVMKHRSWYYHESVKKSGWGGKTEVAETHGEDHLFHLEKPNSRKTKDFIKKLVSFIHEN